MTDSPSILYYVIKGKQFYLKVELDLTLNIYVFSRASNRESATVFYANADLFDAFKDAKKRLPDVIVGIEKLYPDKTPPNPKTKLQPATPKPLDIS